jgi:hypothetical protein
VPRIVQADVTVLWDGEQTWVRHGTLVDIAYGSLLETAYGGPGNLRDALPRELASRDVASKAWLAN